jgi:hypothetical protein
VPELAPLSRAERKRIWRECYWRAFRRKSVWVAIVVYVACLTFGLSYGREFGSSLIGVIIGGGVGGFIYIQVVTRAMLPDLRAAVGKKK